MRRQLLSDGDCSLFDSFALPTSVTIEPMICEGSAKALTWPDEWTATTVSKQRNECQVSCKPFLCAHPCCPFFVPVCEYVTQVDGKRSAQFEHTLLITDDGVEALTGKKASSPIQFWERESAIHQGVWLGTTPAAKQKMEEINAKLLAS